HAFTVRLEPAPDAPVRLADLRALQQLLARGLSAGLSVQRLALHRTGLPVPEGSARLARSQTGVGRRPLVVPQDRDGSRLVAPAVLVMSTACGDRSVSAVYYQHLP